jgi:Tfp pilus assembly protein PilX
MHPRGRQRGFSLIIVFLLIIVMVGLAAALMVSTQGDLQVAGQDREAQSAFYAAEASIAFGKDWLTSANIGAGTTSWSALLSSGSEMLCVTAGGARPGTTCDQTKNAPVAYGDTKTLTYQFCFHNNADDPRYFDAVPTGDTVDGDGALVIEGYGYFGSSTAHVAVQIAVTAGAATVGGYSSDLGGSLKRSAGDVGSIDATKQAVK